VNVGRIATEIQHFSCQVTGGIGYVLLTYGLNPQLPFRLEPHTTRTFWLPAEEVPKLARVVRDAGQVSGRISAWMSVEVSGPNTLQTESFPVLDAT
jgi:hypothetical protein